MTRSLLERNVSLTQASTPQFQPSQASAGFFNELSRSLENTSNEMKSKSDTMYVNEFMTSARKSARDIYSKNADNPEQLSIELGNYKQGLLQNMPNELKPKLDLEYGSLSSQYIDKATNAKNAQLTLQQKLALRNNENQIVDDLAFAGRDIFNNEGLSEDEVAAKNITSINQMATSLDALEGNLTQIGADGKLLRTPQQVNTSISKAKEAMFSSMAKSWLDSQPDKLKAYSEWLDNKVTIELPEGSLNVRDSMNSDVRKKIDRELIQQIKDDVYIDKQQNDRLEKEREVFADETKKALYKQAEKGDLTPAQVNANKNILDFEDFRDFSRMAREADPITNGNVYGQLINKIESGQDVTAEIKNARFNDKTLSNADFEKLLNKSKEEGTVGAIPDSVDEGRDFMLGFLGSNTEVLSLLDAQVVAKAERDYNGRVQDFINENGRQPNRTEALDMADTVVERWNIVQADQFAATLPKPKHLPLSAKVKRSALTDDSIREAKEKTLKEFKTKYNGDIERMKQDKEFIEQIKLLKQYQLIINNRPTRTKATK